MPFIREILKYDSLAVVGLEKNCGKTECLNYILRRLPEEGRRICVTSIGIDGESVDQVTGTAKPEIVLREGFYFSTSETHYRERSLLSEIRAISDETTSLGRVVTGKVIRSGSVILSGPASSSSLKRWMGEMKLLGMDLTVIDGALSRLSSASPAVSRAMVLATGAALSSNMATLVSKTAFAVKMIRLPVASEISSEDRVAELSSMTGEFDLPPECTRISVKGALTDRFLKKVMEEKRLGEMELVVKDFTRIFIDPQTYSLFVKRGGRLTVERSSKLVAVCVNPLAPNGYRLDSERLCAELSSRISLPVYDIVKNRY